MVSSRISSQARAAQPQDEVRCGHRPRLRFSTCRPFDDLQARGLEIARRCDELNLAERGRTWTPEEIMLGFVGDVGDLAKLVMATEGARSDVGGRDELRSRLGG